MISFAVYVIMIPIKVVGDIRVHSIGAGHSKFSNHSQGPPGRLAYDS